MVFAHAEMGWETQKNHLKNNLAVLAMAKVVHLVVYQQKGKRDKASGKKAESYFHGRGFLCHFQLLARY